MFSQLLVSYLIAKMVNKERMDKAETSNAYFIIFYSILFANILKLHFLITIKIKIFRDSRNLIKFLLFPTQPCQSKHSTSRYLLITVIRRAINNCVVL